MTLKNLTTKWPLAAVWMQMSLHLPARNAELFLRWLFRNDNVPGDDLTNGDFSKFTMSNRVPISLDALLKQMDLTLLDRLLGSWDELEVMVKKRKAEVKATSLPAGPFSKKSKKHYKEKWG